MTVRRILVVEDEVAIAEPLLYVLRTEGFEPTHVTLGTDGLKLHETQPFDMWVLDVGLPDGTGFDVLRRLRNAAVGAAVPVMFLTARQEEIDKVLGLELGADDYVVKPFSPREVVARIRAILRRGVAAADGASGGVSVWKQIAEARRIEYRGQALDLTRNEYELLALLLNHPGRVFSRDAIMDRVWREAPDSSDRTVDAHIKTLRAKLRGISPDEDPIRTYRGIGYALELG